MTVLRLSVVCVLIAVGAVPSVVRGQAADSLSQSADSTDERTSPVVRRVATAFTEGDADRLLTPAADRVEISLFGARTFYSSAQALYVLREFFRRHVPRQFRIRDVMETETNCFVRGKYEQVRRARPFRVYVRLGKPEGEDLWRLREVRIEGPSG